MSVSSLVGEFGGDEDLMIAGLLHDTLEDQPEKVTVALLMEKFGWRVAHVVRECSDTVTHPKPPWKQRKVRFLERLAVAQPDVKLVSAADKLHNARTMLRDVRLRGDEFWGRFNAPPDEQCWYLRSCVTSLRLGQWENDIVEQLDDIVRQLEELCGIESPER